MEGYTILEEFPLDPAVFQKADAFVDAIAMIIRHVAFARGWEGKERPIRDYLNRAQNFKCFTTEQNDWLSIFFYGKEDNPHKLEGLLLHVSGDPRKDDFRIAAFVFPEPDSPDGYGYYERSGSHSFLDGDYFVYRCHATYADDADIHDHDHTTYFVDTRYNYKTRTFYYPAVNHHGTM